MKPRIAVLASGGGTTAEAFIRAAQAGSITAQVELIIVSREDAGVWQRIEQLNSEFGLSIEGKLINAQTHPAIEGEVVTKGSQTQAEEAAMLEVLQSGNYDLIALMGYMKRIGPRLVQAFGWVPAYTSMYQAMMTNTHPGLLPDTKGFYGANIQQYVLDHDLPYGGQTLHLVSEDYDDGPILAEHKVAVQPDDTADTLFARVQAVEKQYLPGDIEAFIMARRAYLASISSPRE